MIPSRRGDLLGRHTSRTGLSAAPHVTASAALAVCDRSVSPADARTLLEMLGLIHPDGPAPADVRATRPRAGAAPKRNVHRKRVKAK